MTRISEIEKSPKTTMTLGIIALVLITLSTVALTTAAHNCAGPLAQYSNICGSKMTQQ
jgi:formate/nitrite transporter FocA (FNT family)